MTNRKQHNLTPEQKSQNGFIQLTAKDLDNMGLYRKLPYGLLHQKAPQGSAPVQHKSIWPKGGATIG